ncbi:hypothetical protein BDN67DRAFT_521455 [Paxillus ammoniavirescens]|nr:hypothetical protein BDN67DRAFT_521455 [Paxillus ammoniavirescens]
MSASVSVTPGYQPYRQHARERALLDSVRHNHSGVTTPQVIDRLVNENHLEHARDQIHRFCELPTDSERLLAMLLDLVRQQDSLTKIGKTLTDMQASITRLEDLCRRNWNLSDAQEVLLRRLIKHYLIKPNPSYSTVSKRVGNYVYNHAATLRLLLYTTDPTVRHTINDFLSKQTNNLKLNFRKAIFKSVTKNVMLGDAARQFIKEYHLPEVPAEPPVDIKAALALLRQVAAPLTTKKHARGGDSGFWDGVEKELDKLYKLHGNDRTSVEWLSWETQIIGKDEQRFSRLSAEETALTRSEVEQSTAHSSGSNGAQLVEEDNEDGDIDLHALGNIAATIP